jgi:hypothetical protein
MVKLCNENDNQIMELVLLNLEFKFGLWLCKNHVLINSQGNNEGSMIEDYFHVQHQTILQINNLVMNHMHVNLIQIKRSVL